MLVCKRPCLGRRPSDDARSEGFFSSDVTEPMLFSSEIILSRLCGRGNPSANTVESLDQYIQIHTKTTLCNLIPCDPPRAQTFAGQGNQARIRAARNDFSPLQSLLAPGLAQRVRFTF
jgi:hypothetical protein